MITSLIEKAKAITFLLLDVDGVLTDGKLYFDVKGEALKAFHVQDGLGLRTLMRCGIEVGILTSRSSLMVTHRMEDLKIRHVYQNVDNKLATLPLILSQHGLTPNQIAYMGDDLIDLALLRTVGLSACPKDAVTELHNQVDFISTKKGGKGAVRELCDLLLKAQGRYDSIVEQFASSGHDAC